MNDVTTGARKKQNLVALYSILEYCEEPYVCRRLMQLKFLGEDFDATGCNRMCDNCKTGLRLSSNDLTESALKVLDFLQDAQIARNNFTMNHVTQFLRGKKVDSKYPINKNLLNDYTACL